MNKQIENESAFLNIDMISDCSSVDWSEQDSVQSGEQCPTGHSQFIIDQAKIFKSVQFQNS